MRQDIHRNDEQLSRRLFVMVGMHRNGLTYKQIKRRYGLTREEVEAVLEDTRKLMGDDGFAQLYVVTDKRLRVKPTRSGKLVPA